MMPKESTDKIWKNQARKGMLDFDLPSALKSVILLLTQAKIQKIDFK